MLLINMKNLRTVKNNLIFLLAFFSFYPLQALVKPVSFCSKELISLECIDQENGWYSFEGKFRHEGFVYEFSTRRPYGPEFCLKRMEQTRFITSAEQFCVLGVDHSFAPFYVTLEGFFSSRGKWTYFKNYEEIYYEDYDFGPICECLGLEEEEVDSYTFLNLFNPIKTIGYLPKKPVNHFQTKTDHKDNSFIDKLLGKVFNFLRAISWE